MIGDALLAIRDLTIDYAGHIQAVRGATIEVHLGEAVGLVGESGSGKSTLAAAITGLLPVGARIGNVVILPTLGPFDPATGEIVGDDMESQLRAVMQNMDRVLEAAGCTKRRTAATATSSPARAATRWRAR